MDAVYNRGGLPGLPAIPSQLITHGLDAGVPSDQHEADHHDAPPVAQTAVYNPAWLDEAANRLAGDGALEEGDGRPWAIRVLGLELDRTAVLAILTAFLLSRLIIFGIILVSSITIPMRQADGLLFSNPGNLVLDGLVRHDSWWYANIATHGYTMGDVETGQQGNTAFFPLYPMLVRLVAIGAGNVYTAGILISNLALLAGLAFVYALARHEFDEDSAARTVLYISLAPAAVFFSAMYTESLFLLAVAATFYYARTGQLVYAAVAGALATATRNTGIVLAAVVALEGLRQVGFRWRPPLAPSRWAGHVRTQAKVVRRNPTVVKATLMVATGLLAYMAYLGVAFGDPLGFIHVQATWGRDVSGKGLFNLIGSTIKGLGLGASPAAGQLNPDTLLNIVAVGGAAILVLAALRKLPAAYALYAIVTLLVPLSTGSVGSMTRYALMLWPAMLVLGYWGRRPMVDRLVLIASLPLMTYFTILFSHWYFAG